MMPRFRLIVIVACLGVLLPELTNGLSCITCDDCNESNPGVSQECDESKHGSIPDSHTYACSYEAYGARGKLIRKRCTLIRVSPSRSEDPKVHCYESPLYFNEDCICYCDDCNKEKPDPEIEEKCDRGQGNGNELKSFIGIKGMILGVLILLH